MNPTLLYIEDRLRGYIPEDERRETAMWLICETTGLSRGEILCKDTKNIPNLEILIERVCSGEPLQYIFGKAYWGAMTLKVTPDTLIPRPETWELVEAVKSRFAADCKLRILDIGTGSGCIAIALKKVLPECPIEACDISYPALKIAADNAIKNNTDIRFFRCDILSEDINDYDIIVSNPPYVMEHEKTDMQTRVLQFEPHSALFVPDSDPLLFYRTIAQKKKAGHLFFEINEQMGGSMKQMLQNLGYKCIELGKDIYGKDRIITAELS